MILSRDKRTVNGKECVVLRVSSDLVADVPTPRGHIYPLAVLESAVKKFNEGHGDCGISQTNLGRLMFDGKKIAPADSSEAWHISHITKKIELREGRVVAEVAILDYSVPWHKKAIPDKGSITIELGEFLKELFDKIPEDLVTAVIVGNGNVKVDGVVEDNYRIERIDISVMGSRDDVFPKQAYELISGKLPEMIAKEFAEVQPMPENVSEAFKEAFRDVGKTMPEMCAGDLVNVQPMMELREGSTFNFKMVQLTDEIRAEYTVGGNMLLSESQMDFVVIPAWTMKNLRLPTEAEMFFEELLRENPGYALAMYSTGPVTWMTLCGRAGIAVIEESTTRVVAAHTTCMN